MVKQTAKQIAINTAKQFARESNEMMKDVGEQLAVTPEIKKEGSSNAKPQEGKINKNDQNLAKLRSNSRQMQELRQELEGIEKQDKYKELQRRISEGEDIALIDYVNELSSEQREVLESLKRAVHEQKDNQMKVQGRESLPQIISKRARGAVQGMVKKRNSSPVEMRQPPSG